MMNGKQPIKGDTEVHGTTLEWPFEGINIEYDHPLTPEEMANVPYLVDAFVHLKNVMKDNDVRHTDLSEYAVDYNSMYAIPDGNNLNTLRIGRKEEIEDDYMGKIKIDLKNELTDVERAAAARAIVYSIMDDNNRMADSKDGMVVYPKDTFTVTEMAHDEDGKTVETEEIYYSQLTLGRYPNSNMFHIEKSGVQ